MSHRNVIQAYYGDLNNLADLLAKLVNSYRLLIGSANELNGITLAKKGEVKDALKKVDDVGDIIDNIIEILEAASHNYLDYCTIRSEILKGKMETYYIQAEIDEELKHSEKDKD